MLLISRITDKLMTVGRPTHCTGTNSWTPGPPTPRQNLGVRTPNPPVVRPMCVLLMSAQSCSMRPLSMFKRGCSCTSACLVVDNNLTTIAAISIAIKRMQLKQEAQLTLTTRSTLRRPCRISDGLTAHTTLTKANKYSNI